MSVGGWNELPGVLKGPVLYDVIHSHWQADERGLFDEISRLKTTGRRIILVDGFGTESFRHRLRLNCGTGMTLPRVDTVVAPYVGESEFESGEQPCGILLAGPRYFPLASAFRDIGGGGGVRSGADVARATRRILVTCGGTDPNEASARIVAGLTPLTASGVTIDIVVGALFSDNNRRALDMLTRAHPGAINQIHAPRCLSELMLTADLCVCANGLTKYELAAMGVPTLALSTSENHHAANTLFARHGSLSVLGLLNQVPLDEIARASHQLLRDPHAQARMSQAGRSLVDGHGADRILQNSGLLTC